MLKKVARTAVAIIAGLFAISILVEVIEFSLVAIANGGVTTDPVVYLAIRNQIWVLIAKLFYNTGGGFIGGYIAARISGYAHRRHGIALAAVQTLAFAWAVSQPDIRETAPFWLWALLIPLTATGILLGSNFGARRERHRADSVAN